MERKGGFFSNIPPSETERAGDGGIQDGAVELKSAVTVTILCEEAFGSDVECHLVFTHVMSSRKKLADRSHGVPSKDFFDDGGHVRERRFVWKVGKLSGGKDPIKFLLGFDLGRGIKDHGEEEGVQGGHGSLDGSYV